MKSVRPDFRRIWHYSIGFYGVWVAHIGREMGLLEALEKRPMTVAALAASTRLHYPAVKAWCSAALAFEFIHSRAGGKLWVRKEMASLLTEKSNPDYLGGQLSYLALRSLNYGSMSGLFRSGKVRTLQDSSHAIEEATHWDHYAFLRALGRNLRLHRLLMSGCSFADIGCGAGSLLVKLCQEYPKSKYYGIDPSANALAVAKQRLKGMPATIKKMKAENMHFVGEFDFVYLGESLYAADDKGKVLAKCYRSLKPKGTIAIIEGLIPQGVVREEEMIIMGMQIDFALEGQRFMTLSELEHLLHDANFRGVSTTNLGGSVYLIMARK